ncbi:uncharacterized protein EV154DRAFT_427773 [Mucor mucedo]|uniref:uncharacterized protein n=1 Tax=Mucor mucedo TaxID=29922 RepID=UPI00221FE6E2|nr:uncharacterized protein EV154DRAFT_427773 [Mucor mucedo]KAI7884969.1 hypothetical protein EV154DRAFT_427773 [Mucor mucedo]
MEISCIIIYDNTASASVLYASEGVTEILGYTPEELRGFHGYKLTHPDERAALGVIHNANVMEERMSSVTAYRALRKDGSYVELDVVVHYCYDTLVTTNFIVTSKHSIERKMRSNTADYAQVIDGDGKIHIKGAWVDPQEGLKKILELQQPWGKNEKVDKTQEPRFCMILNRYTTQSTIVFATKVCEELVDLNQLDCIGRSLYDYVASEDAGSVMKQIELSKSNNMISRIRFDWITGGNKSSPVEAVVSCTYDGLVMVVRLASGVVSRPMES